MIARRDQTFGSMLNRRLADQQMRLALVIDDGKLAGDIGPSLPTDALVALWHAISIGFAMSRIH